jgi:preprotein translocase subunit SecD
MELADMLERALRTRLRFDYKTGRIDLEDVYCLSPEELNTMAKDVSRRLREEGDEDFLTYKKKPSKTRDTLTLQLEILKRAISIKEEEQKKRDEARDRAEKRQRITEALNEAETAELRSKSVDELRKMLEDY